MNELVQKLEQLSTRLKKLGEFLNLDKLRNEVKTLEMQMGKSDFWKDIEKARKVTEEHAEIKKRIEKWEKLDKDIRDTLTILRQDISDKTVNLRKELEEKIEEIAKEIDNFELILFLSGKYDRNNAIVSFHAGAGGVDAQDWTEMLLRMITRFCERKNFKVKILDEHRGSEAGIKSAILFVEGFFAYGFLKSEHGVHRLVRISPFDAEKMRHTSFALVEVLPELEDSDIKIEPKDLRIDTFLASGHGGQYLQKTETAVRITHIPTGIVVSCQSERSQSQNKETALKILRSKLYQLCEEEKQKEKREIYGEYKSAAWGNQVRSYVLHPYKLVKDHRTGYEETDVEGVLDGKIDRFVEEYLKLNS
jgi:peptide chain release factor 2